MRRNGVAREGRGARASVLQMRDAWCVVRGAWCVMGGSLAEDASKRAPEAAWRRRRVLSDDEYEQ